MLSKISLICIQITYTVNYLSIHPDIYINAHYLCFHTSRYCMHEDEGKNTFVEIIINKYLFKLILPYCFDDYNFERDK